MILEKESGVMVNKTNQEDLDFRHVAAERMLDDVKAALKSNDFATLSRVTSLYETFAGQNPTGVVNTAQGHAEGVVKSVLALDKKRGTMEHAAKCLHTWRENLQVGDPVDAYDQQHRTWYTARVATAPTPTPSKSSPLAIELHWFGFSGNQKVAIVSDVHDASWGISPANSRVIKSNLRHTIRGRSEEHRLNSSHW